MVFDLLRVCRRLSPWPLKLPIEAAHFQTLMVLDGLVCLHFERHVEPVLILSPAKSTVSRLHETTAERNAREKMMVSAVRTILECIGEDPDREGLLKTPERYAQAIMWMTRGYEERLAGKAQLGIDTYKPSLYQNLISAFSRCNKRCRVRRRSRRDGLSSGDRYFQSL